ncbi:MAG: hypothetical protein ACODAU_01150 [Myxococcota bacterium]
MRIWGIGAAVVMAALALGTGCRCDEGPQSPADSRASAGPTPDTVVPDAHLPEPRAALTSASVYWVGHSLVDATDMRVGGAMNIMNLVGYFARSRGDEYAMYPHIKIGAPLAWTYFTRSPEHLAELRSRGELYDVFVMTEAIPLDAQVQWNASHFYARRFFCAIKSANPDARVFLYETWHHLHASDPEGDYPPPHVWDWRKRLAADRTTWESIADAAATGEGVTPPDDYEWSGPGPDPGADCQMRDAVHIVPAGQAMAALYDQLDAAGGEPPWNGLDIDAFFYNGYRDWPDDWPLPPERASEVKVDQTLSRLSTYDPSEPPDDIHPSALGAYYVGLVHYATIYRRSPVGLPAANGVSPEVAEALQELAWQVVRSYPRSGVAAP